MAEPFGLEEVRRALAEDRATDDVTTALLGSAVRRSATAEFVAEGHFVVAGLAIVASVYEELDRDARAEALCGEGQWTSAGAVLARVRAAAGTVLAGERVALNFLQRLSGVATVTRRAVDAVAGTGARITHTRKTTPGLRTLERYAVTAGGGVENRGSLVDAVLWKDNHWVLLGAERLAAALARAAPGTPVVVEVETDTQLDEALAAGVRHILVDNQTPERVAAWVRRAGPGVTVQASGGITAETARAYAEAGAHLIAIGELTHSVSAAPIRCDILAQPNESLRVDRRERGP
ncbi:MAG: carboxylating nicotinate-nucleotide diphosphorylase [Gemmatimonadota bacterium]